MLCPGDLADEDQNHTAMCLTPSLYSSCCLSPTCNIQFIDTYDLNKLQENGRKGKGISTPSTLYLMSDDGYQQNHGFRKLLI